ncbi:unnamed protein product [Chondrus crispus]|uniref:tRNA(His) guanylyltransferase n=1 Tax=Chondrus crispus TaxID=2769 RepID=S0F2T0_CHOCR|nr:unnamed protein product [Chondrus crispus]CDF77390.1 unnamed protein product [Chondrus crispus]|eukprot:XP_005712264.1 unnamed protein product [Chondrus crispus]
MACSRFEYVKAFERHDRLLPGCWAVIRLDGRSFTNFSKAHAFAKPNDSRALRLCNAAAEAVLRDFDQHLAFAYGESDEFSFVLKRQSALFARRESKILSTVVSLFSSAYVFYWNKFMGDVPLKGPPSFDGRVVLYPTTKHLRDYLAWRQADTHVNNLFNTAFWALVKGGKSQRESEEILKGTSSKEKNEMLFTEYGINYNDEDAMFRKGSFIVSNLPSGRWGGEVSLKRTREGEAASSECGMAGGDGDGKFVTLHVDIIGDTFWNENPDLLAPSDLAPPRIPKSIGR